MHNWIQCPTIYILYMYVCIYIYTRVLEHHTCFLFAFINNPAKSSTQSNKHINIYLKLIQLCQIRRTSVNQQQLTKSIDSNWMEAGNNNKKETKKKGGEVEPALFEHTKRTEPNSWRQSPCGLLFVSSGANFPWE